MFSSFKIPCAFLAVSLCSLSTGPMASAALISQVANASASTGWNTSSIWGSAPTAGNDYQTISTGSSTAIYVLNGTTWNQNSWSVRDVVDASNTISTTFGGDHLIVNANTSLNGRATGGSTQTVNLVLNGGMYRGNTVTNANQSTTLAGTVAFGTSSTMGVMGALSPANNTTFTFNLSSTIIGAEGNTLQLTMNGGATRTVLFNVTGDLSNFSGTIYAGVSSGGVAPGVSSSSAFAITSSALSATLQLDTTTTNFHYNLGNTNVSFGALALGNGIGIAVNPGTYDATALNTLAGGSYFTGVGTITVVPEPDTTTLSLVGMMIALASFHLRRSRKIS